MAGTDPPGGPANGMRTRATMKMLKNHLMVYRSHLILVDRPEDRSLPAIIHISFLWTARNAPLLLAAQTNREAPTAVL